LLEALNLLLRQVFNNQLIETFEKIQGRAFRLINDGLQR
jgi:hypothetical protein